MPEERTEWQKAAAEVKREVALRKGVYGKWKAAGRMPNGKPIDVAALDRQLSDMERAATMTDWLAENEKVMRWLFKNRADLKALWTWWEKTKQEDEAVKALHENFPGLELAEAE